MAIVYGFTLHCQTALKQIRATCSRQDISLLFRALRAIATNPLLPGSGLSFHDPADPKARLYRVSAKFLIFYHMTDQGTVEFTDVWFSTPSNP
jgi:hypothetical protein